MLIIFDLDDTLIDTSGVVTPFKLKECLKKMVGGGLSVTDFDQAYSELVRLNRTFLKTKDTLTHFAKGNSQLVDLALRELSAPLPLDFAIPTTPHAKEILDHFRSRCQIALVTGGHPPFQLEKLKKAGIDRSIFSKIAIPEDSVKKPFYEGLMNEFSVLPQDVIVCGDRIPMDLVPAHELGCKTVHMRWGRGALMETEKWIDHSISDLRELIGIIK